MKKEYKKTVKGIQRALKIRKMRNVIPQGKTVTYKTKDISKIVFQSILTTVPEHIVNELQKKQNFLSKNSIPRIKYQTLCNEVYPLNAGAALIYKPVI